MRLFQLPAAVLVESDGGWFRLSGESWDTVVNRDDLHAWISRADGRGDARDGRARLAGLLPPIGAQEVWAAGVTYFRSRTARMEESKSAGGGDFYDRVYDAARPELFFKATPHRVRGHGQPVRIRRDSRWNVPEPELALVVSSGGTDRRLHHRQRHELARHRGREPALPAAGQGLRRQLRARPVRCSSPRRPCRPRPRCGWRSGAPARPAFEGATTLASMKRQPGELVE